MRASRTILWLTLLLAALAFAATCAGLMSSWLDGGVSLQTAWGGTAFLQGRGLYRHDSVFIAAGFRGQDGITLAVGLPLLLVTSPGYWRRPTLRRGLLLLSVLAYFLYVYASMALGAAYNVLFIVYVAAFSASFFAFVGLFGLVKAEALVRLADPRMPRRGPAIFMLAAGLVTLGVWLSPVVSALVQGVPPALLDHYTTMFTYALDLAIVTPTALLAGVLILRRDSLGYLLAVPLLGIIILLAPTIIASTLFQKAAGVSFTTGEVVGPISGFVVLGGLGVWTLWTVVCRLPEPAIPDRPLHGRVEEPADQIGGEHR
jgi:hypothetical protein